MADIDTGIDWTGCELVEQIQGKVSGQPIVRGTRILPEPVVRSFDRGENMEQIVRIGRRFRLIRLWDLWHSPMHSAASQHRESPAR